MFLEVAYLINCTYMSRLYTLLFWKRSRHDYDQNWYDFLVKVKMKITRSSIIFYRFNNMDSIRIKDPKTSFCGERTLDIQHSTRFLNCKYCTSLNYYSFVTFWIQIDWIHIPGIFQVSQCAACMKWLTIFDKKGPKKDIQMV